MMDKKVGDEIKLYGLNYKDIEFEFQIVGAFPPGSPLGGAAAMRYDYLTAKMDDYKARTGKDHPQADRSLNLIWVRMPSKAAYEQLAASRQRAEHVQQPGGQDGDVLAPPIGSFLEPFKDILWGLK